MHRPALAALLLTAVAAPAWAKVPQVVTDIPPVQSLVAQVMGDLGTPEVLLLQGANAHDTQLKPSQAAAVQDADLVFWVGPQMTPWLGRTLATLQGSGTAVTLLDVPGTALQDFGAPSAAGEENDAHNHATQEHGEADHGDTDHGDTDHGAADHAHSGLDPHAWLRPDNAALWLLAIADALGRADPENAATYQRNAEAARTSLATLDAELRQTLTPVAKRPFVVFHDAYGYFAAHYGLSIAGSVALGDASDPGAAHLTALRAALAQKGVVCAFPEANHDAKRLTALLEGTAVKEGAALSPEGSALPQGPGLYGDLMRGLARDLSACLTP